MPTLDASSPSPVYRDTVANTSLTTASFTPPSGSVIVAFGITADTGQTCSGITSTGPTMTSRFASPLTTNNATVVGYTGIGTGSAITVSASFTGAQNADGLVVTVWTSAQLAATPATHAAASAGSQPSDSITATGTGNTIVWLSIDWNENATAKTYRGSPTEISYHVSTGNYVGYVAYQATTGATAQTYGLTAPTGQQPAMGSIEVQASGGAPAIPPILIMQTRRPY